MSWPSPVEVHYGNSASGTPYNSIGSFMDFFGGLTYDHVNFIYSDAHPYTQENIYPSTNTNFYKFGFSEPGSFYCDYGHGYVVNDHTSEINEYGRNLEIHSTISEESVPEYPQHQVDSSTRAQADSVECKLPLLEKMAPLRFGSSLLPRLAGTVSLLYKGILRQGCLHWFGVVLDQEMHPAAGCLLLALMAQYLSGTFLIYIA